MQPNKEKIIKATKRCCRRKRGEYFAKWNVGEDIKYEMRIIKRSL